jgi:hypothetical protein
MDIPVAKPPKEEKLGINVQIGSIPACNSHDFPKCQKGA